MTSVLFYAICMLLLHIVWKRYGRGLNKIPGPFLASWSSLWKFYVVWCEDMPRLNTLLHEKHGPLVRIGPNHVSASSPQAISAIYRGVGFQKSRMYSISQPKFDNVDLHNLFSTQDFAFHASMKRHIGGLYSMTAIVGSEHHIDTCVELLVGRWTEMSKGGSRRIDMSAWMQYYAFDCLGEVNLSRKMGFLAEGTDVDGVCALEHKMMQYYALMGQVPAVEKLYAKIRGLVTAKRENPLYNFTLKAVRDRQENPSDAKDILNSLLEIHQKTPKSFSIGDVIASVYINILTAHDVVAITLRALVYYLAKHQDIREKMTAEILEAEKNNDLSIPVKYMETLKLSYVHAVILETLRIHPSTGLILERYVPKGGVELHNTHIKEGTVIGINCWVINRNKSVFGDDVETFRPERWIESDAEQLKEMKRCLFTFSTGSRTCIGKNLAMMQIGKVVVEMYRHFEIELADPNMEWRVSGAWLTTQTCMDMNLTKR